MKTVSTGQVFSRSSSRLSRGFLDTFFLTALSSRPSSPLSCDLSPAKTHGAWLQDLMKLRLLMSHCQNSVKEVDLFRFRE